MPIIIKNGKVYGDRSVTLSQAEYNALSEVEKNNGTTYYIYDVNGVVTADDVALDGGTVETLAGSVATFESSPATSTHEVGDHILWNGQLYTVTAAIAVGETLTVGTNISSTTVGTELTALNAGLTSYTEGIWKVRKYPDGTAECWGMTTISTNITSVWGSLFINAENSISFPSGLFIAMPVINLTAGGLNNSIPFIAETTTKDELTYRVVRPTSQTVASVTVHAHAIGRWK